MRRREIASTIAFQTNLLICAILIHCKNAHIVTDAEAEAITSAANPLLKDVRRAIARGGLTAKGCCVAETFHLLEEALRSGCEMPVVLAAESVAAGGGEACARR